MSSLVRRVASIAGTDDWYDAWGAAINLHFDIATVLDAADVAGDTTPQPFARWQYQRPPFTPVAALETIAADKEAQMHTPGEVALAQALLAEEISQADLIRAGDVLDRYGRLLTAAGRDY